MLWSISAIPLKVDFCVIECITHGYGRAHEFVASTNGGKATDTDTTLIDIVHGLIEVTRAHIAPNVEDVVESARHFDIVTQNRRIVHITTEIDLPLKQSSSVESMSQCEIDIDSLFLPHNAASDILVLVGEYACTITAA